MLPVFRIQPLGRIKQNTNDLIRYLLILATLVGYSKQERLTPEFITTTCLTYQFRNPIIRFELDLVEDIAGRKIFLKGAMQETEVVTSTLDEEPTTFTNALEKLFRFFRSVVGCSSSNTDGLD